VRKGRQVTIFVTRSHYRDCPSRRREWGKKAKGAPAEEGRGRSGSGQNQSGGPFPWDATGTPRGRHGDATGTPRGRNRDVTETPRGRNRDSGSTRPRIKDLRRVASRRVASSRGALGSSWRIRDVRNARAPPGEPDDDRRARVARWGGDGDGEVATPRL
jgi:hypothetical protein